MSQARRHLYLCVINDLNYDQRMIRIASSLARAGYAVTLVGRRLRVSQKTADQPFAQRRLRVWVEKGPLAYAEYNVRLWLFLLSRRRLDATCGVDLDTLPAAYWAAALRGRPCVYDAHEYFTEVPELVGRPRVQAVWEAIARHFVPRCAAAYTVCASLAEIFAERYGRPFGVLRNVPFRRTGALPPRHPRPLILYQGALNEGRGLAEMIAAMRWLPEAEFWLAGEGDLSASLREQARQSGHAGRIRFLGHVRPAELPALTAQAWIGVNLLENKGLNYYYSLANKSFDYVQAGRPAIHMDFPEYRRLLAEHEVGLLASSLDPEHLAALCRRLLFDESLYRRLSANCAQAAEHWHWAAEEGRLLRTWAALFT